MDALDVSSIGIELLDAPFVINAWSREAIEKALSADIQKDCKSFGKLEVISVISWGAASTISFFF